jgi:hypothetical protein
VSVAHTGWGGNIGRIFDSKIKYHNRFFFIKTLADTSRIPEETEESGQQAPNNGDRASGAGPSRGDGRGRGGGRGRGRAVGAELMAPGPMTRSKCKLNAEFAKMQISLPLEKELHRVIFFFSLGNCLRKSPEKSTSKP